MYSVYNHKEVTFEVTYVSQVVEGYPYYENAKGVGGLTKRPWAVAASPLSPVWVD